MGKTFSRSNSRTNKKMIGEDIHELVAVDFIKADKTKKRDDSETNMANQITLTEEQKKIIEANTKMSLKDVTIKWKAGISGIGKSDISAIENATRRSCDFWTVPTNDTNR